MSVPGLKRLLPGVAAGVKAANYWELKPEMLNNAQVVIHPLDRSVYVPTEPHWYIEGTVIELITEDDGDHHMWLKPDGSTKDRVACEFTPQQPLARPAVGAHIRVYGILRYDHQHQFWELHPIDLWEAM